jgi:acetyl-CoA carboxylase carboxyl transferase subunit beta
MPDGLWVKCKGCKEIIYRKELDKNFWICKKCNYHFRLPARSYILLLTDHDSFEECDAHLAPSDPLQFKDTMSYPARVRKSQENTGLREACITGTGLISGITTVIAFLDFAFMGGSMGSVVGEKIVRSFRNAMEKRAPVVIISSSGGARMQEGIFSLMQMAKTAAMAARFSRERLPFISILTNPTTAGVMASYASLGDIIIAEPGALLGFTGPRVIKQAIGEDLPEGFQRSEFFLDHGMVDMIVQRKKLKSTLTSILRILTTVHGTQ